MHVFERRIPDDPTRFDVVPKALETADQRVNFFGREQSRPAQAPNVGDRAGDVVEREDMVEVDRTGELRHPLV